MALLANDLLPASFRGAPFAVLNDSVGGGRRQAVHTYPGRDEPWAEDMGRAPRTFSFRGFIVTGDVVLAGGPIQLQRALLLAAFEKSGPGLLTHPTLGIINVSVTRFNLGQDLGAGRMSVVDVEFVESGKKSFPSLLSTSSGLLSAANICKVALAIDLARGISLALGATGAPAAAARAASACTARVVDSGKDATALRNLASQLSGNYGRYYQGANGGFSAPSASSAQSVATVDDLVAVASAQRAAIAAGAGAVASAADNLNDAPTVENLADALIGLLELLLSACADPADAVRLLSDMIANPPSLPASMTGDAIVRAFQRAAAAALAEACARYQPSSFDDAAALLNRVAALLDGVATAAADAGDDASFGALEDLIAKVAQDLRARGADLAPIATFTLPGALPDVVLAQRLYRDPSRADQLVRQCPGVINPLFMPAAIQALAA